MLLIGFITHAFVVVAALALGDRHSMILKQDSSVWSTVVSLTGDHFSLPGAEKRFVQVIPSGATAVTAGTDYSIVLTQVGGISVIGQNNHGQLGDGTKNRKYKFTSVRIVPFAKAVAAGGYHTLILTQDGGVWASGWNNFGQLGDVSPSYVSRFRLVLSSGTSVIAIATGDFHSMVLKQDGSIWAAGRNKEGQLGDGSKDDRRSFVKIMSSGGARMAGGDDHSIVLKRDGSVWTTGSNEFGQLGDGSPRGRSRYVQAISGGATAVAAGRRHSIVLKQDGCVWTAGYNLYGQLGDGTTTNSKTFVQVTADKAKTVAAGAFHSMLLKQDGSIWATGSNQYGQFGDGTATREQKFVRIMPFGNGTGLSTIITFV